MKALVLTGPEMLEMQDLPEPTAGEGEAIVRVSSAGICGSDIHGFLGHSPRRRPPLVLGHEAVGTVAAVHESVNNVTLGQRVYINPLISCGTCEACRSGRENTCTLWRLLGMDRVQGAYAEYVAVPAAQLQPIPGSITDRDAVLAEPFANLVHCIRISMQATPNTMAIFGAGTMGNLALQLAKLRGIDQVFVADTNAQRLEAARHLGATVIDSNGNDPIEKIRAETDGRGVDYALDAVGVTATRRAAAAVVRRGGRIALLGLGENESSLPFIELIRSEIAIFTTFAYTPADFRESIQHIEAKRVTLCPWSETRPLSEGQACFDKMTHAPGATLKLILRV
jgi:2-desacetyl-2-hydroxyethyl bacteriochlorophyllide A dehydrogenase